MESFKHSVITIQTDIDRNSSYDHARSISDFAKQDDVEVLCTDTTYVPQPNKNSTDKGDLITNITYRKKVLSL